MGYLAYHRNVVHTRYGDVIRDYLEDHLSANIYRVYVLFDSYPTTQFVDEIILDHDDTYYSNSHGMPPQVNCFYRDDNIIVNVFLLCNKSIEDIEFADIKRHFELIVKRAFRQ